MNVRRTLTWIAVAALGVGLTTAMTITTTLLSQQPIALASEPLSAGDALVAQKVLTANVATVGHRVKAKPHHRVTLKLKPYPVIATQRPVVQVTTTTTTVAPASPKPVGPLAPIVAKAPTVTTTVESSGSSGDQGSRDGAQQQEGDVQSEQRGADD